VTVSKTSWMVFENPARFEMTEGFMDSLKGLGGNCSPVTGGYAMTWMRSVGSSRCGDGRGPGRAAARNPAALLAHVETLPFVPRRGPIPQAFLGLRARASVTHGLEAVDALDLVAERVSKEKLH